MPSEYYLFNKYYEQLLQPRHVVGAGNSTAKKTGWVPELTEALCGGATSTMTK